MSYADEDYDDYSSEQMSLSHSRWGIASFIIGLGVAFADFLVIAVAGFMQATTPGGIKDDKPIVMLIGFGIIGLFFVNLLGLGFGIAGLCESQRNKMFAVLGTIIGILTILAVCGLLAIGLAHK